MIKAILKNRIASAEARLNEKLAEAKRYGLTQIQGLEAIREDLHSLADEGLKAKEDVTREIESRLRSLRFLYTEEEAKLETLYKQNLGWFRNLLRRLRGLFS